MKNLNCFVNPYLYDYEILGFQIFDTVEISNPYYNYKVKGFFISFSNSVYKFKAGLQGFKSVDLFIKNKLITYSSPNPPIGTLTIESTCIKTRSTRMVLTEKFKFKEKEKDY